MARAFLTSLNLSGNQLLNAVIQVLATAPASPAQGQIYFDSTLGKLRVYSGSSWVSLDEFTLSYGTPGTSAVGDSAAGGSATSVSRSDHTHGRESFGSVTSQTSFGGSSGSGSATTPSRSDHTHGTPTHDGTAHSGISVSSLGTPTGNLSVGGYKVTNLGTPTADTDAATKAYVDAVAVGIDFKPSVRVATTADITLSGTQSIDGVSVIAGDRVLVKNQTTGADNGIYVVAAGSWSRSTDADSSAEVTPGLFVFVEEGTSNADTGWVLSTNGPITLGTTGLTFVQYSASGSYSAGNGLTLSGSTFNVGAGTGITVNADDIAIDTSVVARKYATSIGDGSATSYTVTHSLGTKDVIVQVFDNASPFAQVECDVEHASTSAVTIKFTTAPTSNAYRVVVTG